MKQSNRKENEFQPQLIIWQTPFPPQVDWIVLTWYGINLYEEITTKRYDHEN